MNKQLVMGMASNYDWKTIAPFVISLRESGYDGDVVLFTDNLTKETRDELKKLRIKTIRFSKSKPFVKTMATKAFCGTATIGNLPDKMREQFIRFPIYWHYLETHPGYDQVGLFDVRDVAFFGDPFVNIYPNEDSQISVFQEHPSKRLATCPYNTGWITETFGRNDMFKLRNEHIICNGVVIGTYDGIVGYCKYQTEMLNKIQPKPYRRGIDQAILNRSFHFAELSRDINGHAYCHPYAAIGSKVRHVGYAPLKDIDLENIHVLHQYDRFPALKKMVEDRYGVSRRR